MEMSDRARLLSRWGALKGERSSWVAHWRDISTVMLPRAGRYFVEDRNKGAKRHQNIVDGSATRALRVLGAGLMGGMTSPARPWFKLTTPHEDLNKLASVKVWLSDCTHLMQQVFAKSNCYRALHQGYEELAAFGTFSGIVTPDFNSVIHIHPLTAGEFCIASNWRGDVDVLYREFQKPVGALVKEFGREACSNAVKSLYDKGNLDAWVQIVHAIEPRADRNASKRDDKNMAWRSVYFEAGQADDKVLRERGFNAFPALAARWATWGSDIYGTSPAMDALGDVRQLQLQQRQKAQAIDFQVRPPLQVPSALKNREVDALPGGVTFYDANSGTQGIKSMYEVRLDLAHLTQDISETRARIEAAFFTDMFLMISQDTGQMTAYEVARRNEEKMMMLGPVLERLHNELLDPLVEATFTRMIETGIVPPPPPEMQGVELNVEFVSMLAQAQQAITTNAIDRFVLNLGQVAQLKPEVLDKLDADEWAEAYSDRIGLDPRLIVAGDKVALIRQQRAQAQAEAQKAQQAQMMADAAHKLGTVQTGPGAANAAADVMGMFSGY